jgi:DNA mismatch endonuclease (patch repair protein)
VMSPEPLSDQVKRRFQRQRIRDTAPELALRRELHRRGLRYRVDVAPLRGVRRRADVVFPRLKMAIFIDGCFWHRCPTHGTEPKNNAEWWREKLERNVFRDRATDALLRAEGWTVLRVWEHEEPALAADRVESAVGHLRQGASGATRSAKRTAVQN